jgi:hypothetical protein
MNGDDPASPPKSWHRLILSLFGIGIITGMWVWAIDYIVRLPADKLAAFSSVTTNSFYTIAAIVIFMITGRLVWEWSNATTSASTVATEVKEEVTRRIDPKDIPGADDVP